jgi:hypothetical protein
VEAQIMTEWKPIEEYAPKDDDEIIVWDGEDWWKVRLYVFPIDTEYTPTSNGCDCCTTTVVPTHFMKIENPK